MPLPLPNLDTRRWADLIDEARGLVPVYAQTWSDHNYHDPGVTLLELLAWLLEQELYRANRVPARHRRKFLALVGYPPAPPLPARAVLHLALRSPLDRQDLPAGLVFVANGSGGEPVPYQLIAPLTVVAGALVVVQGFDGQGFVDRTRGWQEGSAFPPLGPNPTTPAPYDPARAPAVYLAFDRALPTATPLSLYLRFAGPGTDAAERERIEREDASQEAACAPRLPRWECPPLPPTDPWCPADAPPTGGAVPPPAAPPLAHHAARTAWDFFGAAGWVPLRPAAGEPADGEVVDDTRALTLDGAVRLRLPAAMAPTPVGVVGEPRYYLRCRLVDGSYDAAPLLRGAVANAVEATQTLPAWATFPVAPTPHPAAASEPPFQVGVGSGQPGQELMLPGAPIARGAVALWTNEGGTWREWQQRPDLDASRRTDAHFMLEPTAGEVGLGDGEQGRLAPAGTPIVASYAMTLAAAGALPAGTPLRLADNPPNRALLGADFGPVRDALAAVDLPFATEDGADAEDLDAAAGRAVEALWAHERLVELCAAPGCTTLDQLDRAAVLARVAPPRATTTLDFERLALDVPGTRVARVRCWAGIDPGQPCLHAPGTVTVVIVPALPPRRPYPSAGLLGAVRRYLDRRRVLGTRLVVVGPDYLEVRVQATVQTRPGAEPGRVSADVVRSLDRFLDPLTGGPVGRGWPFGRDVYRAEVLQVVDGVPGVDHVLGLELIPGEGEAQCGNLCVPPTCLVTPGPHRIELA